MLRIPVRPEVRAFKPYQAGLSIEEIRARYGLERVIKLSSNENPLGVSPLVREALARHASQAFRYPQSGNPRLVKAIAALHGVPPERIVTGNGSDEILDLLFRVCATPGVHNIAAFRPCFGIYVTQARLCGLELRQADLNPDFSFPWDKLLEQVDERTALVLVTNPDNPSGRATPAAELIRLAEALPPSCLLVVDEAYMDFADPESAFTMLPQLERFPNLALVRTFSKSRGLAGARLGYGLLPGELAELLWRVRLPFSVNVLAEEAGLAALEDTVFHAETLRTVAEGRRFLSAELADLGFRVYPSQTNFVMFEVPPHRPGISDAAALFEAMLRQGVILRPLGSYGLPRHLRVSVGTGEENRQAVEALRKIVREGTRA